MNEKITDFSRIEPYIASDISGFHLVRNGSYDVYALLDGEKTLLNFEPVFCVSNFSKKRRFKVYGETEYTFIDDAKGVHEFIEKVLALTDEHIAKKFRDFFYDYTPEQAEESHKSQSEMWGNNISDGVNIRFNFSHDTKPSESSISKMFTKKNLSKQIDIRPYSFHLFSGRDVDSFAEQNKIFNVYVFTNEGDCFCLSHIDGKNNSPITQVYDDGDVLRLYHWGGFSSHLRAHDLSFLKQKFVK